MPDRVVAPDGTEWAVGRRWLPRPPRWVGVAFEGWRKRDDDAVIPDAPRVDDATYAQMWGNRSDEREKTSAFEWWRGIAELGDLAGAADDVGGGACLIVAAVIGAVVIAVAFIVFVVPAVIFVVDLLFVLVVAAVAIAARVLFRRPWIVVAENDLHTYEWAVVGWRASGAAIELVKRAIARGESLDALRLRLL